MKHKFLKSFFSLRKIAILILVCVVIACSTTIDSVVMPSSVQGGAILPVTLNVTITTNTSETSKFMVAMLVPKAWNAAQNSTVSFTSDITTGDQGMTVIPAGTAAPQANGLDWPTLLGNQIGNGGNLLSGYEWVAFYSNTAYTIAGNVTVHATVTLKTKVSNDNISFKLGYVVANSSDGLSGSSYYGAYFPGCFRVNGTGDLIDFCNPQLSTVEPINSLDNDIITINFDSQVATNALTSASSVYLCATGITTAGDSIVVCSQNTQTQMTNLGLGKWRKDIWPRQLFSLKDNQTLKTIQYYFTDQSGGHKVGYGGGLDPFPYTFKCK